MENKFIEQTIERHRIIDKLESQLLTDQISQEIYAVMMEQYEYKWRYEDYLTLNGLDVKDKGRS